MNVRSFSFPEKLHVTCREFVFCKDAHRLRVDAGRVLAANKACDSLSTANALMADEAATRLLNDEEFMLAAVEINALQQNYVLQYASEQLRSDAKFMLQAIHLDCETLDDAAEELCSNQEFMLTAVTLLVAYGSCGYQLSK